jgi:hypothetical protein
MRLVVARAVSARTLLVAAGAAALVTGVLLTAFVLYASLLPLVGVREAVSEAPLDERTLLFSASAGENVLELTAQDEVMRELLAGGLAGVPLEVFDGGYGAGQQLPEYDEVDALVAYLPDLPEHARLREGVWPQPAADDEPVQVGLPVETAAQLGLAAGDQLVIRDTLLREERPVRVVGVWEPEEPDGPYWQLLSARESMAGPFAVHPAEFAEHYSLLASQLWLAYPDPGELAAAGMAEVVAELAVLEADLLHRRATDAALADNARLRTGMDELGERLLVALVVNRSGLVLPAGLLAVIAGYGLVMVAGLLVAHRRGENALLRARGASRRQLVRLAASEALLVVAPAALLAAPVGSWLVTYVDRNVGERSFGVAGDLAPYGVFGPPSAWVVALATAAGCAVALAAPSMLRGRSWMAEQQERSRPGRLATVRRTGVDVALVATAVLAWMQLRQYGQAVTPRDVGGVGVDPLLVAAPVVGVLAATAVALRLLPAATRLGVRLAGRRDAFAALLGMWQADRRPQAGPVLLLVLAVATAVLAPSVAATWQQSQRDQAAQLVGADVRLVGANSEAVAHAAGLAERPEVTAAMPAQRSVLLLPEGVRATLLAIDSEQAAEVTRVREDVSDAAPDELFMPLYDGRPRLEVASLPDGAERLTGRVEFTAPEPIFGGIPGFDGSYPMFAVSSLRLWIHVIDERGVIWPLRLAIPQRQRATEVNVALPPGATAVVGLSAGLGIDALARVEDGELVLFDSRVPMPEPGEVRWEWNLATVGDSGNATPLKIPDGWRAHFPADHRLADGGQFEADLSHVQRGGDRVAVAMLVDPAQHHQQQTPFMLAGPLPSSAALPVLATSDVLVATGAEQGQVIQLDDIDLQIVGTVSLLPGTEDGSGVAVDLAWLSLHRFAAMAITMPEVNEWWLATSDGSQLDQPYRPEGLQTFGRDIHERRLLGDPLGSGVLLSLWTAAAAGALLAAFGLAVDARASAVRRGRELAVLHTLGASPPMLARALVIEQAVLAGLGVLAGVAVGLAAAATMGTSLVLTPTGGVPVPEPLLTLRPTLLLLPTAGLFVVALVLASVVARRARRDIVAGALRIGAD